MRRPAPRSTLARGGVRLALLAGLVSGSAAAQETESAPAAPVAEASADDGRVVELNERGSSLYAEGDYRRAVELFLQAYAVDGDPNLLFNIAACYEGLGDRDAALEKYRAFLADPNADPEGRPRAEGAIQRLLDNENTQAPEEPLVAPTTPPAVVQAAAPAPTSAGPEPDSVPPWLPWAVLGGGAALGVAGVSLYVMGAADHREVTDTAGYDDPNAVVHFSREHAEALIDSGDTKKVIGATTAAVGGAVVIGYVLWRVLGRSDEQGNGPSVDVALSPSAASLAWSRRF
jgi:tetratricopeptide (TPR) repeat protein